MMGLSRVLTVGMLLTCFLHFYKQFNSVHTFTYTTTFNKQQSTLDININAHINIKVQYVWK